MFGSSNRKRKASDEDTVCGRREDDRLRPLHVLDGIWDETKGRSERKVDFE